MFALGTTARTTRRALTAAAFACLLVTTACGSDDADAPSENDVTSTTAAADETTTTTDVGTGTDDGTDEAAPDDTDADVTTPTIIAPPDGSMSAADWIDEATAAVQSAKTACEVLSVTNTDISAIEPDEAAARKAGQLFAASFRRLSELSTTMSADDKASIEELAAAIDAEATSDATDMTVYIEQGPSMISDPKYMAAQVALLTGTENC